MKVLTSDRNFVIITNIINLAHSLNLEPESIIHVLTNEYISEEEAGELKTILDDFRHENIL
jgi:hypothetical protein